MYNSKFHEIVKVTGGYNIYRNKGTKGQYYVDSKKTPNAYAVYKTQKAATNSIKNSFKDIKGGKM